MPWSTALDSRRADCAALAEALGKRFQYVSVLGTDVKAEVFFADRKSSGIREGRGERGFGCPKHR